MYELVQLQQGDETERLPDLATHELGLAPSPTPLLEVTEVYLCRGQGEHQEVLGKFCCSERIDQANLSRFLHALNALDGLYQVPVDGVTQTGNPALPVMVAQFPTTHEQARELTATIEIHPRFRLRGISEELHEIIRGWCVSLPRPCGTYKEACAHPHGVAVICGNGGVYGYVELGSTADQSRAWGYVSNSRNILREVLRAAELKVSYEPIDFRYGRETIWSELFNSPPYRIPSSIPSPKTAPLEFTHIGIGIHIRSDLTRRFNAGVVALRNQRLATRLQAEI